ncbi:MAG: metallophosphoesterase [Elusimicrobia bacterium]|nr:metallophosphoesterase [Candidatus Liberimonas magnetica]
MKIIYTTDLHGNAWKYKQLVKAASEYKPDIVINGGDMLTNDNNLHRQKEYILFNLSEHFKVFNEMKIYYLCYPGNDDLMAFDNVFEETCNKYLFVKYLAQKKIKIGDYDFIGMNFCVDFPFLLKDRCRKDDKDYKIGFQKGEGVFSRENGFEDIPDWKIYVEKLPTIEEELERLEKPADYLKAVYVMHMPPADLGLDVCSNGEKVGSKAIYRFIKQNQPMLTLHGHIHESPVMSETWKTKLGETVCVQPGQGDHMGDFVYITVNLEKMNIERKTI